MAKAVTPKRASKKGPEPGPKLLAEQIAEELGWQIALRHLQPGERIREIELAKRYEVSRPLVREVLQRLEVQGLVETVPWKGARVPKLTETQLSDLFEFIALTFGFVCRLAAKRATAEQLERVDKAIHQLERIAADPEGTPEDYERARLHCHTVLEGCMGETQALMQARPIVRRVRHQFSVDSAATKGLQSKSCERWRALYSYLKANDVEGAEAHACSMVLATREFGIASHRALAASNGGT